MLFSFIAINLYFVCNWPLFNYLEKGDWRKLLALLRVHIFERQRYCRRYICYFVEVAIRLNNLQLLRELFEELQSQARLPEQLSASSHGRFYRHAAYKRYCRKHRITRKAKRCLCEHAIELGLPQLMEDPGGESEVYFGELRDFPAFCHRRYRHKYRWAELFYAISLLVQGKLQYAANLLEAILLHQMPGSSSALKLKAAGAKPASLWARRQLREDALLQLLSIHLLEELQEDSPQNNESTDSDSAGVGAHILVDQQLIELRRSEIQKIYATPKHWFAYLFKEQKQNIAIVMIQQLINAAYEQQLRPTHQAYLAKMTRGKTDKTSFDSF